MYNLEKIQCELYDKYCLKKTCRNVENFLFFWLSYIYIKTKQKTQRLTNLVNFYCATHTHTGFLFIYIYIYIYIYIPIFVTLYVTLPSLSTWKLSAKFYETYKLLINWQKSSNIKDKITTNGLFDNTFKVNEQKR